MNEPRIEMLGTVPPEVLELIPEIVNMIKKAGRDTPEAIYVGTEEEVKARADLNDDEKLVNIDDVLQKDFGGEFLQVILEQFKDKIPYNGITGDSCCCEDCNLRRAIRGTTTVDHERDVDEDDKAALLDRIHTVEAIKNEIWIQGYAGPFEDYDVNSPEFDKLSLPAQTWLIQEKHHAMARVLLKRSHDVQRCIAETIRNTRIMGMMEAIYPSVESNTNVPLSAKLVKALLVSRIEASVEFLGYKKDA